MALKTTITIQTGDKKSEIELANINFDENRDQAALRLGRVIIDTAFAQASSL